jgi:solute carrier family 25 carnitine/acylcarnitine transporter 20/29
LAEKGVRPLYTGLFATIMREAPGSAIYYSSYEIALRILTDNRKNEPRTIDYLISGSLGGISYWTLSYPNDVIKTKMQTHSKLNYL